MQINRIDENIYLIDLIPNGIEKFVASYILKDEKVAIVETGPASTAHTLLRGLNKLKVKPKDVAYIAISHIHLDHAGGAGALMNHLKNAKLVVHPRGAPHMADPQTLWKKSKVALGELAQIYGKPEPVLKERIIPAFDGTKLEIGSSLCLQVVETLGHASHHLSYYETLSKGVFPGDAAGIFLNDFDSVVPTIPAPYRLDIAMSSLDKLMGLESKALFYSHFGRAENATEKLQLYRKQLKLWENCAKYGIEQGESLDAVAARILKEDTVLQRVIGYIQNHQVLSKTVMRQSVEGIMEYVRNQQS